MHDEKKDPTLEHLSCPQCRGSKLSRYGKTAAGRQKYRCLNPACRRQFVYGSDHLLDPETKKIVMNLLSAGVEPVQIHRAVPEVSLRWIYELRRRTVHGKQN